MKCKLFNRLLMGNITGDYVRWEQPVPIDAKQASQLSEILSIPKKTSFLLLRRTGGQMLPAKNMWTGQHPFPEVMALPGIDCAVARISQAVDSQEHVLIYSDFDADGVTSAVILKEALEHVGIRNITVFFPSRFQDGYGFHSGVIEKYSKQGVSLVVTADCGITGQDACNKARALGIDVIVTDHHKIGSRLPDALSIINPQLPSWQRFNLQNLSGAGVAYLLAKGIFEHKAILDDIPHNWAYDMLVLSIAGDSQPVTGLNRMWIKEGLKLLKHTRRPGILALSCVSGIFGFSEASRQYASTSSELLDILALKQGDCVLQDVQKLQDLIEVRDIEFERDIMFGLVPRINAAGRLSHAHHAFDLLCENNVYRAFELARYLDKLNQNRRKIEQEMLEGCFQKIDKEHLPAQTVFGDDIDQIPKMQNSIPEYPKYSVCAYGPSWHEGIAGIAASRVRDRYYRPCALIAGKGPVLKGSVRGIPGFNVHEALTQCKDFLLNFGGHEGAGGFSVNQCNMLSFARKFEIATKQLLKKQLIEPVIQLDDLLNVEDCHEDLLRSYVSLEPFGRKNPRPLLGIFDCRIASARLLGKSQKHLELTIEGANPQRLIWFGAGHRAAEICLPGACDVVFTPNRNVYLGREQISLFIEDLRPSWSLLGSGYRELSRYIPGKGPTIIYTWSKDAAAGMYVALLSQGIQTGLHFKGQSKALVHNAGLILKQQQGVVVSTSPWELTGDSLQPDTALLVAHPPISGRSWERLLGLARSPSVECIFLDNSVEDSNTWLSVRFPAKEYMEKVWKSLAERPGSVIPIWEAGPLHLGDLTEPGTGTYQQKLVLLVSCISIMMELGMISYDVVDRIPRLVLHRPQGQVSLSGSELYLQGRQVRKIARRTMEKYKEE